MILSLLTVIGGTVLPVQEPDYTERIEGGVVIDSSNYSPESEGISVIEPPVSETPSEGADVLEIVPFEYSMTYYANMELSAYTWSGSACADGTYPSANYTAASNDPNLWHKWIYVEGVGDLYVHDTGGMDINVIDVYVDSYDEAVAFGRWNSEVYVYD